jgi:hypothetical protein
LSSTLVVLPHALGKQLVQRGDDVGAHAGVRVLVDDDGRRRMADEDRAEAFAHARSGHHVGDARREVEDLELLAGARADDLLHALIV